MKLSYPIFTASLYAVLSIVISPMEAGAQTSGKVTYLYNSGLLIETKHEVILIDYVPVDGMNLDTLVFTKLKNAASTRKKSYILITHDHHDHFHPPLLQWHNQIPGLTTILGWPHETKDNQVKKVYDRGSLAAGSLAITAHPATDAGSGFLIVATDNLTIYHAGDHALWADDLQEQYADELTFIKSRGAKIDMMFIPVVNGKLGGCKPLASIRKGAVNAMEILDAKIVFPMHLQCDNMAAYKEFAVQVQKQFPSVAIKSPTSLNQEFTF